VVTRCAAVQQEKTLSSQWMKRMRDFYLGMRFMGRSPSG
jgi:hypothetical protein